MPKKPQRKRKVTTVKHQKKIIAIIPARGGSKRLPGKNIKKLLGKPLIAWTIEAAQKSKYLERIIVSTEDKKIARISQKYGAETIKRPKKLSADEAKTIDVVFDALKSLKRKNYTPELMVLLQPTSPLRTSEDIDKAIKIFLKNKCKSVISVREIESSTYWCFQIDKYLKPFFGKKYFQKTRRQLPKIYKPNGAIFISRPEILFKHRSFYCDKTLPYIMPLKRSIDIDNEIDLKLAGLIIKNERNKNRK